MKRKKIFLFPLYFLLTNVLYIGCCKCMEGSFFSKVVSVRSYEYSRDTVRRIDTVKIQDTLFTNLKINAELVGAIKSNPMSGFVNSAYAFSCDCLNDITTLGYKFPIDSLTITSNQAFKGIAAGNDLSGLFKANYFGSDSNSVFSNDEYISIDRLLDSVNLNKQTINSMTLIINPTPIIEKTHRFTYKLFSNGQSFAFATTRVAIWN